MRATRFSIWDAVPSAVIIALVLLGNRFVEGATTTGAVLGVVAAAALVAMRRQPLVPAVAIPAIDFVYLALDNPGGPALLSGPVCMLGLGYFASRRVATTGVVLIAVAVTAGRLIGAGDLGGIGIAVPAWAIALALVGSAVRHRHDQSVAKARENDLERQRSVISERLRIARDLHDSVAHALATINVQSNVADRLVERDTGAAREAISVIRTASADALDELGWLLNSLRDTDSDGGHMSAGLDGIGELVARARANGLRVTVHEPAQDEPTAALPASVDVAAYRVVQEALSNVTRHVGPPAAVSVRVERDPHALIVSVVDDGHGVGSHATRAGSSTGMGIVGMRERVESTGGVLDVGPDGSGFAVRAQWPLDDRRRERR